MKSYKRRHIRFHELIEVNEWKIKVYIIQKEIAEPSMEAIDRVKVELPRWLEMKNSFNSNHDHHGFLVIHFGNEGIFSIITWWVDTYMSNTHVFLTPYDMPNVFDKISGDGLAPCIWEMEVINHERVAYMNHVLTKIPDSDWEAYFEDVVNVSI